MCEPPVDPSFNLNGSAWFGKCVAVVPDLRNSMSIIRKRRRNFQLRLAYARVLLVTIGWGLGPDYPGVADPRIQLATASVLNRLLGISPQP